MAKKSKKKLQSLINKKQLLQNIKQEAIVNFNNRPDLPITAEVRPTAVVAKPTNQDTVKSSTTPRTAGLGRMLASLAFTTALFIAAIIFDWRSSYFDTFGNWLYQVLRLDS